MRIFRFIIAAILLLISNMVVAQPDLADKAFRERDFNKTITLCDEILESSPENVEILQLKAMAYQEMQEYGKALEIYEQIKPENKDQSGIIKQNAMNCWVTRNLHTPFMKICTGLTHQICTPSGILAGYH